MCRAQNRSSYFSRYALIAALQLCVFMVPMDFGAIYLVAQNTTAWQNGSFHIDRASALGSSAIVLQRPNERATEAMPLGNGRLGVAVWAEHGYTAQLNRSDTLPYRLSPGRVVLPGLSRITHAPDYSARLNLYDGQFEERGGGMTAVTYVAEKADVMIIDVAGADPRTTQSAELTLWAPRRPNVLAQGHAGMLAETWLDDQEAGASHETFGSLAVITAEASRVQCEQDSQLSVRLTFRPHADGSFRILVSAPSWRGKEATSVAAALVAQSGKVSREEHRVWWHKFWSRAGFMKMSSSDGSADYLANLRDIDLFTAAAESRDRFPGSQAGIGDLFSSVQDTHKWGPSAYWHWNLRMQVSANLAAGLFQLNEPYFRLYRENLPAILKWTKQHMAGRSGACIPETMRFNGAGFENETWISNPAINCGEDFKPYYNARTLSTGAEVSLWIWQQFLYTDDLGFLRQNYQVIRESALFLLDYAKVGADGLLSTFPSNAHETKWDVHNPTTDIAAMRALFPVAIAAGKILHTDEQLGATLQSKLVHLPEFPLMSPSAPGRLVSFAQAQPDAIIAESYDVDAPTHNTENIGLEPVWPYHLINPDSRMHALAVQTYLHRPYKNVADWSADPEQAASLGLAEEMRSSLLALTQHYQAYPSGMAGFMGSEFYVEQIGVLTDALQSALVQDEDDTLRIAPAWPKQWSVDATLYVKHQTKVDVQIHGGEITTVGIEADRPRMIHVQNPWPEQMTEVLDAHTLRPVLPATSSATLEISLSPHCSYLLMPKQQQHGELVFRAISGESLNTPRELGSRSIGLRK